jgi:hypothetical protein
MKNKKYYILETRRRINEHINQIITTIGVFSSVEFAVKWIKKNRWHYVSSIFFALCTTEMNEGELIIHSSYNTNGQKVDTFTGKLILK